MHEQDRDEIEMLKRRQDALQRHLTILAGDIEALSVRLSNAPLVVPEIHPLEMPARPEIVPAHLDSLETAPAIEQKAAQPASMPPPLPPVIPVVVARETPVVEELIQAKAPPAFVPPSEPESRPKETFEMKVGTYWLVRVGIVMLLTGLVFLGTYAYKNFIGKLDAGGKVALLYTASAALLGFGGWLQRRREKEPLRNYGQVLFAGGLAAVYFTTYAAHHVEVLRVIASPVIDGLLLLGWGALTVWIADRRKSEVLALFAVGLSYYTSAITDVGFFTLYSNLVLTLAAVFFLVRNRWITLSFISLAATYGGFAFWRFHFGDWGWDARTTEVWNANFFLAGYWLLFTTAAFCARGSALVHGKRALFASVNNGAFYGLVLLSMIHAVPGRFWIFSLGLGAALLGAAVLARWLLPGESAIKNTYVVQGLTLVTVGFIAHFAGLKLALILAAESVILTVLGHQQKNLFIRAGGYITGALSAAWVFLLMGGQRSDVILGSAVGAAFLFNAWWEQRLDAKRAQSLIRPFSGYFVALLIGVCGVVAWHAVPEQWRSVTWMLEALLLIAAYYVLRLPELPIFSQALTLAALVYWFVDFALRRQHPQWFIHASVIAGTLALIHWWQRQKSLAVRPDERNALQFVYGLALLSWVVLGMTTLRAELALAATIGVSFLISAWWEDRHDAQREAAVVRATPAFFVVSAILVCAVVTWRVVPTEWRAVAWMIEAVLFTAGFYALRIPELPIFAQGLAVAAQGFWFFQFALSPQQPALPHPPHWLVPAALVSGSLALSHWWQRQSRLAVRADVRNVLQIIYGLAFVGVIFFWFQPQFAPAAWLAFLSALAMAVTVYAVATRAWLLAACAQIFLLVSSIGLFMEFAEGKTEWHYALVPLASWLVLGMATTAWLSRHDAAEAVRRPLLQISTFYRVVAFVMSLWWIHAYVQPQDWFWVLSSLGLVLLALAGLLKNREALAFCGLFLAVGFVVWFAQSAMGAIAVNWPNGLALLAFLAARQIVRRWPQRCNVPTVVDSAALLITGVALWLFVTRWVVMMTSGAHFYVTVSWAGLFAAGFALRERLYRWLGLGILACAVSRVFLSDVWKLMPLYRILSFLALGVVLLALGFIYNKYQEKIRQWL
jgi:hypothetical protein